MISIVIPAYNEKNNIGKTIKDLKAVLSQTPGGYEIIIVDDHSSDDTFAEVMSLKSEQVKGIRLSHRAGPHNAIRAGFQFAKGEGAMCLGADGQEDYSVLPQMIKLWREGHDVIWGLRKKREEPLRARIVNGLFYKILEWVNPSGYTGIDLLRADFFLIGRKVINAVNASSERNSSLFGLVLWMGFKQGFVEYDRNERRSGRSKWSFARRLKLATDWIISFSGVPIRFMTGVGMATALLGFIYAGVIILNRWFGHPVEGWSSILVLILLIGGVQMVMLGMLGEYLWRSFDQTKNRPLFLVENITF